ncbi:TadA family conjugal transfer-associated ATPase [Streptosporangium saharense]|uniref:Pilus assembly protein CpaF n=1 Tax=Streptosporangium saharense TaxID=1706840 RepID=A0A7W7QGG6_9ACTN|nr:TadA family conjugal transfer-associated ATPase [Streptosporangium saharense]MBB4913098.1 pilus assembly protein CpaF [Streptosporangium saharense]
MSRESTVSPEVVEAVRVRLARAGAEPSAAHVAAALRAERAVLGDAEILAVTRALCADLIGAGPLEPLLAEPDVTDVLVNGPEEVWVDDGRGLRRTSVTFPDEETLRRLAQRLAASAGRRLDDACPFVDARLTGGVRLHAVLPPVATGGTCLSLRLPPRRTFTMPDLVRAGTIRAETVPVLDALVRSRLAFLVAGGTGTGKTTLLSALLSLADPGERLMLVEDSAELRPLHPHVVRLETRPANLEGAGGVCLRDLVRQALRMRPDRLVVGEVRGAEVVDLLNALNTGHEGGCGTLHANTAVDVPPRLEALACAAGLSREAVHSQIAAALDVVIHLVRDHADGRRRVAEICVMTRRPSGLVEAEPALTFSPDGRVITGPGLPALTSRAPGVAYSPIRALPRGGTPPPEVDRPPYEELPEIAGRTGRTGYAVRQVRESDRAGPPPTPSPIAGRTVARVLS